MANLVTKKQKVFLKKEYIIRIISVILFMLALLGVFMLAYVLPYYFSLSQKILFVDNQLNSAIATENKENIGESVLRIVNRTNSELRMVDFYKNNKLVVSDIFLQIIDSKNSSIQLNRLAFTKGNQTEKHFIVVGTAKNRAGLVAFVDSLKSQTNFLAVDSPISDFARESDISFTISITVQI